MTVWDQIKKGETGGPFRSFTTEPKRHIKRGNWRSIDNATDFMEHLNSVHLKRCSYSTLVHEFTTFFGSNDLRTVERYLGRPEQEIRSSGSTQTIRLNRDTGKMAQFQYFNTRRIPAKKGLMQILQFISYDKESAVIHHERMSYYAEQASLESTNPRPENKEESSESSNDNVCVRGLCQGEAFSQGERARENRFEKVVSLNVVRGDSVRGEEEERDVIDSTHTCKSPKIMLQGVPDEYGSQRRPLTLEQTVFTTKPDRSSSDRAKTNRGHQP